MNVEVLGIVAGMLTATAVIPQLLKTSRTKDASDVSLVMISVLLVGLVLWVIYGVVRSDLPIILTNSVATGLNAIMLVLKIKYSGK